MLITTGACVIRMQKIMTKLVIKVQNDRKYSRYQCEFIEHCEQ